MSQNYSLRLIKAPIFLTAFFLWKFSPNPKANFQKATLMLIDCGLKLQRTKLSLDGKCHGDKYFTANNLFLRGLPQPPANCFTICRLTFKCKKLPPMMINDDHQWSIVLQFGIWLLNAKTCLHRWSIEDRFEINWPTDLWGIWFYFLSKSDQSLCTYVQTWNLSKNLHDPIFGRKNFTHWKCVNGDYFRQQ